MINNNKNNAFSYAQRIYLLKTDKLQQICIPWVMNVPKAERKSKRKKVPSRRDTYFARNERDALKDCGDLPHNDEAIVLTGWNFSEVSSEREKERETRRKNVASYIGTR